MDRCTDPPGCCLCPRATPLARLSKRHVATTATVPPRRAHGASGIAGNLAAIARCAAGAARVEGRVISHGLTSCRSTRSELQSFMRGAVVRLPNRLAGLGDHMPLSQLQAISWSACPGARPPEPPQSWHQRLCEPPCSLDGSRVAHPSMQADLPGAEIASILHSGPCRRMRPLMRARERVQCR